MRVVCSVGTLGHTGYQVSARKEVNKHRVVNSLYFETHVNCFSTEVLGQILWHPALGHAAASGDLGFTVGESESHTFFQDGSPRVTLLQVPHGVAPAGRGAWRYEMDGGNARPAP